MRTTMMLVKILKDYLTRNLMRTTMMLVKILKDYKM